MKLIETLKLAVEKNPQISKRGKWRKEKNIQIDRTQPLDDNSMMVWVNEVNFIDLYNWMILMGEQGGEIEKMNVRKSKKDKVNAQISVLLKTN